MAPRISSYMSSPVIAVSLYDSLAHARNLMLKHRVGRLVVVDDDERPVGMLTVSDLVEVLSGRLGSKSLESILVKEVYTPELIAIEPTKSVKTAAQLMLRHKIGGLPVITADGSLQGIITRTDLVRAYAERYKGEFKASDFIRREYARANRGHSVFYLMKLMMADPAGKVIIEEEGRPVGVVTKRDLAFLTIPPELLLGGSKKRIHKAKAFDRYRNKIVTLRLYLIPIAEDVMTPDPITAKMDEDLAKIAEVMIREDIGVVPIVNEEGLLEGVITKLEILNALLRV